MQINTDIDILAIQDGKFIIGEAKADAKYFTPKVINDFVQLANTIKPDKIILAYDAGEFDESKLIQMKSAVIDKHCEIIPYKLVYPRYKFGGIFGLPHEEIT